MEEHLIVLHTATGRRIETWPLSVAQEYPFRRRHLHSVPVHRFRRRNSSVHTVNHSLSRLCSIQNSGWWWLISIGWCGQIVEGQWGRTRRCGRSHQRGQTATTISEDGSFCPECGRVECLGFRGFNGFAAATGRTAATKEEEAATFGGGCGRRWLPDWDRRQVTVEVVRIVWRERSQIGNIKYIFYNNRLGICFWCKH